MSKMLDKKKRKKSAEAVEKFLCSTEHDSKYDVVISYMEDGHKNVSEVFNNIDISFVEENYPNNEISYSLTIHYGDDIHDHDISLADLPQQNKSYFDNMSVWKDELRFHSSWHRQIWICILPSRTTIEQAERIEAILREMSN